jgi:hypothetical protein
LLVTPSADLTFVHTLSHPDIILTTDLDYKNETGKAGQRGDKHLSLDTIKFLVNKTRVESQRRY